MGWIDPWVGLDWIALGRDFSVFGGLDWVTQNGPMDNSAKLAGRGRTRGFVSDQFAVFHFADGRKERIDIVL